MVGARPSFREEEGKPTMPITLKLLILSPRLVGLRSDHADHTPDNAV
jgi:hypothetical protein